MKIIILHGEDLGKSYQRLKKFTNAAKSRSWDVVYLDKDNSNIKDAFLASSLFGTERFFVIRDIKILTKKDFDWINEHESLPGNLIIYHEGVLNQTFLKSLPKDAKVEEFKLPKLIWTFLEHIQPGNKTVVLRELHKILEVEPPEFVFTLISRHLRDLYWVKTDSESTGFPAWKIGKLKAQAAKFSEDLLVDLIRLLSVIDIQVKTSKADLISSLDLMLIKHLE